MNRTFLLRLLVCLLLGAGTVRLWLHRDLDPDLVRCQPIGPVTWEENWRTPRENVLPALRTGDVLVTMSAHSLGWRHGHCALVVDSATTLEATTLGRPAAFRPAEDWNRYPTLWLLRPADPLTPEEQASIRSAAKALSALPYTLFAPKTHRAEGAHCAALIWYVFDRALGRDVDPEGGWQPLPCRLLRSPFFQVCRLR